MLISVGQDSRCGTLCLRVGHRRLNPSCCVCVYVNLNYTWSSVLFRLWENGAPANSARQNVRRVVRDNSSWLFWLRFWFRAWSFGSTQTPCATVPAVRHWWRSLVEGYTHERFFSASERPREGEACCKFSVASIHREEERSANMILITFVGLNRAGQQIHARHRCT